MSGSWRLEKGNTRRKITTRLIFNLLIFDRRVRMRYARDASPTDPGYSLVPRSLQSSRHLFSMLERKSVQRCAWLYRITTIEARYLGLGARVKRTGCDGLEGSRVCISEGKMGDGADDTIDGGLGGTWDGIGDYSRRGDDRGERPTLHTDHHCMLGLV